MENDSDATEGRASEVVAACELAWRTIQQHHPELPDAVMVLGSGVERGRLVKLGHWWAGRWEASDELRGEVLLAGEALHLPSEDVFEVLLHEAAHGLNAARGVKDASRGGRYHNARYRSTAIEVGLDVEQLAPHGWAKTSLSETTIERYSAEINDLQDAARIARRLEARTASAGVDGGEGGTGRDGEPQRGVSNPSALSCGCGRRMRMAPSVAAQGPVLCGICNSEFAAPGVEPPRSEKPAEVIHLRPLGNEALADQDRHELDRISLPDHDGEVDRARLWARAAIWVDRHGDRLDEAIIAADVAEARTLNELVRGFRRERGHLVGPELVAGGVAFAAGDQVIVASDGTGDGDAVPGVGVLGQVVAVDPSNGWLTVDFPIAGRYRLSAEQAERNLDYGYALIAPLDALPIRPATSEPEADRPEPERLAEVIELDVL